MLRAAAAVAAAAAAGGMSAGGVADRRGQFQRNLAVNVAPQHTASNSPDFSDSGSSIRIFCRLTAYSRWPHQLMLPLGHDCLAATAAACICKQQLLYIVEGRYAAFIMNTKSAQWKFFVLKPSHLNIVKSNVLNRCERERNLKRIYHFNVEICPRPMSCEVGFFHHRQSSRMCLATWSFI